MENLIISDNHQSNGGGVKFEKIIYDRVNDKIWLEAPKKYTFIDLGLSVKWAEQNVGAKKPEDIGLYFAWGETQGYSGITDNKKFTWADYKLCNGSDTTLIKYNNNSSYGIVDNIMTLEYSNDASSLSNPICRTPTYDELKELTANTTPTWETLNDVNGVRLTASNGNSIFIPAGGYTENGSLKEVSKSSYLWSSTVSASRAVGSGYFVASSDGTFKTANYYRICGHNLRPVC